MPQESLFDVIKTQTEEQNWYQNIYDNYKIAQFVKTVPFNRRDFWNPFVASILEEIYLKSGESKEKIRQPLRWGPVGEFKATKIGIVPVGQVRQFTPEEKAGLSKKQSVSVISLQNEYYPPVFKSDKDLVGIMFFSENIEGNSNVKPSIIMKSDGGTVERSYHFSDASSANDYLIEKKQDGFWHESVDSLIKSGFNSENHNEILARIKWDINNPTCQIGIFTDTLKSRLIAQLRATDLKVNTKQQFIPISFYISTNELPKEKIFPYYLQDQKKDLTTALNSEDENIKAIALIVNFLNKDQGKIDFRHMQQSLQDKVWSLLLDKNKLTNLTRIHFLEKFLSSKIDFKDPANNNLLQKCIHLAAATGQANLVDKFLKDYVPDVDKIIRRLAQVAIQNGQSNVIELLFKYGLDPDMIVDDKKSNLLISAAKFGHANVIEILLDQGANLYEQNAEGDTALMIAASSGFASVVKLLIDRGAIPDIDNSQGETALMFAVQNGDVNVVKILLGEIEEGNLNPNLKNQEGNTALIFAVQKPRNFNVVKALLEAGADPNLANNNGDTPLKLAQRYADPRIVELLLEYNAIPNKTTKEINTNLIRLPVKKSISISEQKTKSIHEDLYEMLDQMIEEKKINKQEKSNSRSDDLQFKKLYELLDQIDPMKVDPIGVTTSKKIQGLKENFPVKATATSALKEQKSGAINKLQPNSINNVQAQQVTKNLIRKKPNTQLTSDLFLITEEELLKVLKSKKPELIEKLIRKLTTESASDPALITEQKLIEILRRRKTALIKKLRRKKPKTQLTADPASIKNDFTSKKI